jgi:hypothetical protein
MAVKSKSEFEIRYTDKCGCCGRLWVKHRVDFTLVSATEVRCFCGTGWSMSDVMARNL